MSDFDQPTMRHQVQPPQGAEPTVPMKAFRAEATMPNRAVQAAPHVPAAPQTVKHTRVAVNAPANAHQPPHAYAPAAALPIRKPRKINMRGWLLGLGGFGVAALAMTCAVLTFAVVMLFNGGIFSGVQMAGVGLGGLSEAEAAQRLASQWNVITLKDGETGNTWDVSPDLLGVSLDAQASAARAYAQGRGEGSILEALQGVDVAPVGSVDVEQFYFGLENIREQIETPAQNAGVQFVNGQVVERPAANGRSIDLNATLANIRQNGISDLSDGAFELVMTDTVPAITGASGMVEAARGLLANPLTIRAFDPVTGDILPWSVPPETWAAWLLAEQDAASVTGMKFSVDETQLKAYLKNQAQVFDETRFIDYGYAAIDVNDALAQNRTTATVRVYHRERKHTVQSGETIISIAWDYGVPYPWVQQANGGIESLSVGQEIVIPSPDEFFQFEPVVDKRIVVSISEQRTRVYENGQLKWDWPSSTGISNSPTWPGVYQIISHVPNAFAANWNLWMPYFMGVYQPIPGADFTNGFHGFPVRGTQLLWEGNLGSRVTYGCIMVSDANIKQLYDWAENGVIVEIQK